MTPTKEQPIVVERLTDEEAECHACGKVRRPINLVHFWNLCQHFVGLCDRHLAELRAILNKTEQTKGGLMKKAITAALLLALSMPAAASNVVTLKLLGNNTLTNITGTGSDRDGELGPGFAVEYTHELGRHFAIGAELAHLTRSELASDKLLAGTRATVSGKTVSGLALLRYTLLPEAKVKPYLAAGLGLASSSLKASATPAPGFAWAGGGTESRTLVDSAAVAGAIALRAGADVNVGERLVLGAELGYLYLTSSERPLTADGIRTTGVGVISGDQAAVTFGGRIGYRF